MTQSVLASESQSATTVSQAKQNGAAAAAILSAGFGSFALGILTVLSDRSAALKNLLAFYRPTGALSGVTTIAIVFWLVVWIGLDRAWKDRDLPLRRINSVAIVLLILSLLATFPPVADLF